MIFLKRLFGRKKERPANDQQRDDARDLPHGNVMEQSQAEQDAAREKMESEVADDRERRGATDVPPGSEDTSKDSPS